MDYMPVHIHQDIVVVPVFYVEEVLDQTVSCQRLDEISHSRLPIRPEDLLVDVAQGPLMRHLLEVADCPRVVDKLYQATI